MVEEETARQGVLDSEEQPEGLPDSQLGAVPGISRTESGRKPGVSPSAAVEEWLKLLVFPTQMLRFPAKTEWRYSGSTPPELPAFTTLCGEEMGLLPVKTTFNQKVDSWKGFNQLRKHYKCTDKEGTLWDHLPPALQGRYPLPPRRSMPPSTTGASSSSAPARVRSAPATPRRRTSTAAEVTASDAQTVKRACKQAIVFRICAWEARAKRR